MLISWNESLTMIALAAVKMLEVDERSYRNVVSIRSCGLALARLILPDGVSIRGHLLASLELQGRPAIS